MAGGSSPARGVSGPEELRAWSAGRASFLARRDGATATVHIAGKAGGLVILRNNGKTDAAAELEKAKGKKVNGEDGTEDYVKGGPGSKVQGPGSEDKEKEE